MDGLLSGVPASFSGCWVRIATAIALPIMSMCEYAATSAVSTFASSFAASASITARTVVACSLNSDVTPSLVSNEFWPFRKAANVAA